MRYFYAVVVGTMMVSSADAALAQVSPAPAVTVCDINKDEAAFDGKPVHVRAVYTAWWEGSILADKACPDVQYAFNAQHSSDNGNADSTVDALVDEIDLHSNSKLIDYDVEFDAVFHDVDYNAGWNFKHRGVLEVTHITSWTASPSRLGQ